MQRISHSRLTLPLVCLGLWSVVPTRCEAALPVYGSPGYTPGVGGYIAGVGVVDASDNSVEINDAGVAVGRASRFNAAGVDQDIRALRWSPTASEVLGHLGTSGGLAFAGVNAINNAGVAAGGVTIGFGDNLAVRWNGPGVAATQLQTPLGFSGSGIQDINESGTTLGIASLPFGMGSQAVRWNAAGTPTLLPNLPGYFAVEAYDLNDSGTALGRAFTGDDDRAVRWDAAGAITELGHLGLDASGATLIQPNAMNDSGTAVGNAFRHDGAGNFEGNVPVRWEGLAAIELDTLPAGPGGFLFGSARAINDVGTTVGYVVKSPSFPTDEFGTRAARWDAGGTALTVLGTLGVAANGEAQAQALAINASGLIVGTTSAHNSATDLPNPRAVFWNPTGTAAVDLNTLIDPASGWTLTHALAVSDTGWIAGAGYFDPDGPGGQEAYGRLFLLQVPEPSGLLLLSTLLTVGLATRWRRLGAGSTLADPRSQTRIAGGVVHAALRSPSAVAACLLASVFALAPRPSVGATLTEVGDPIFSVVDVALFSVPVLGPGGEDLFPIIEQGLQPDHRPYFSPLLGFSFLGPGLPHQPPYDTELSRNIVAAGGFPGSVFRPADLRVPNGVMLVHTIVPGDGAPLGQSFDFASGPVLPLDIYPLTETLGIRLNNGLVISGGPFSSSPLQDLGVAIDEAGNAVDFSGLLESHYHVVYQPLVVPPFVPDADLLGEYEWRFSVRDAQGNGWDVEVPFSVVPEPSPAVLASLVTSGVTCVRRRTDSTRRADRMRSV